MASWEAVIVAVEDVKGERWERFRDRYGDWGRDLVLWVARRRCGLTLEALGARAGGLSSQTVSKAIARLDALLRTDTALASVRLRIERRLTNVGM